MSRSRRVSEGDIVEFEGRLPSALVVESETGLIPDIDRRLTFDLESKT
jgi:hypothetical protein